MKNFKKILALLCVAAMLVSALIACTPKEEEPNGGSEPIEDSGSESVEEKAEPLVLVKDGKAVKIIYPMSDMNAADEANKLSDAIKNLTGVRPRVEDDFLKSGATYDSESIEILVGNTGYAESKQITEELTYGQAKATVVGNKLVIAALGDSILSSIMSKLRINISGLAKEGELSIERSFVLSAAASDAQEAIPAPDTDKTPTVVNYQDSCIVSVLTETEKSVYTAYLSKLADCGFSEVAANKIENNDYATYSNGMYAATVAYTGNTRSMYIMSEPASNLDTEIMSGAGTYQKITDTTLTQVGLAYGSETTEASDHLSGMAYCMRLADGSFIVIDGGYDTEGHAERLYGVMQKQAPDPDNIVIAAWIFSHGHGDHIGVLQPFTRLYGSKVTVERFIYNFPNQSTGEIYTAGANRVYDLAYADTKRIKAHAGQELYIRNAKITVLFGLELMEPHELTYYNDCSVILKIEAEGKSFLILGDCGDKENAALRKIYTTATLKSDIMQVAHHGINGCGTEVYSLVDPEYALWPAGEYEMKQENGTAWNIDKRPINKWLFNEMDQNKVFLAEDNIVVLTLKSSGITAQKYNDYNAYLAS